MHAECYAFVAQVLQNLQRRRRVLELGSRYINGSVRPLFERAEVYVGVDVAPGPGVDVVADAATYEADFTPDTVVCCEVLEHVDAATAEAICRNAWHQLGKGGVFILTAATDPRAPHSAADGGPLHAGETYRNVSSADLVAWLSDFDEHRIWIDEQAGDIRAVAVRRGTKRWSMKAQAALTSASA